MEEIDKAFCPLATLRVSITVDTMEMILLMVEILRSPVEVGNLSHYFQGLIHPNGGCLGFLPSTVAKKRFFQFLFGGGIGPMNIREKEPIIITLRN